MFKVINKSDVKWHVRCVTRYLLTGSPDQHFYVVPPPRVSLQIADHVQKVDGAGGVRGEGEAASIGLQRHSVELADVHARGEVVLSRVYPERNREVTLGQAEGQTEGECPHRHRRGTRHGGDSFDGSWRNHGRFLSCC